MAHEYLKRLKEFCQEESIVMMNARMEEESVERSVDGAKTPVEALQSKEEANSRRKAEGRTEINGHSVCQCTTHIST